MSDRERRAGLLARADADAVVALAERCLASGSDPRLLTGPELGTIVMQVREPVAQLRFHLAEVLVTRAEVAVDDARGWAMRLGTARAATLAAAICDAEVEAGRALAGDVETLCATTVQAQARRRADEWAALAPTEVRFEELDQ